MKSTLMYQSQKEFASFIAPSGHTAVHVFACFNLFVTDETDEMYITCFKCHSHCNVSPGANNNSEECK